LPGRAWWFRRKTQGIALDNLVPAALTNLETPPDKLLQIVLFASPNASAAGRPALPPAKTASPRF